MLETADVVFDVWGSLACFSRPEMPVEKVTYPVITPSAARNIACSIYLKPDEFYYEIKKIEIINPIKYVNILKNETKSKVSYKKEMSFDIGKNRTQRNTLYLKDVYYRIYARIIKRKDCTDRNIKAIEEQFNRRLRKGQCFYQPYLGTSECICQFAPPDYSKTPDIDLNMNLGVMLYDVFDITNNEPLITGKKEHDVTNISYFNAKIKNGVMLVPNFLSEKIWRVKDVKEYL